MVWFRVDDGLPAADWVLRIPWAQRMAAVGLWTMAGAWSARNGTDGFVPDYVLDEWRTARKVAASLVSAGVWCPVADGFVFNRWAPDQQLNVQVEQDRKTNAARQARSRERRNAVTNGVTDALVTPSVTPASPVLSNPVLSSSTKATTRAAAQPDRFPEFWQAYPRRDDKPRAVKAWAQAIKRQDAQTIIDAAARFAADPNREDAFTKQPATWLNADAWNNPPLPPRRSLFDTKPTLDDKVRDTLARAAQMRADEDAAEVAALHDPWNTRRQLGTA
jgi:hypothetical protein